MIYIGRVLDYFQLDEEWIIRFDGMKEDEIINEYKMGVNCDEIISYYIKQNIGLITYVVKPLYIPFNDTDEIIDLLLFSVHKGILHFEPNKNTSKLALYAFGIIFYREVLMFIRKYKKLNLAELTLDVETDEDFTQHEKYESETSNEAFDNIEIKPIFDEWFNELNERDKKIITLRSQGKKHTEIGDDLGFTQSYVSRRLLKLKNELKKVL